MGLFGGKEVVGLDIGSSSVKMAHVKVAGTENHLRKFGVFPLPPDAIVDGAIMDHGAVVEGIRTAMRELKIREKEVAISLSGHSVIIKKVQLPTTTAEELEESIQWEVEQYIPFDIKDVGLVPRIVDIDSLAAGNAFELTHPVSDDQVPMVVNVGASFMNINILHAGVPLFTRDVPMGGGMYTSEIQKQIAVSFETAEEYKQGKKDPGERAEKVNEIMKVVSNLLATEAQRSCNFFSATYPDRLVTKVYLTGGAAKSAYLKETLAEKIGVEVEIFDPFEWLTVDDKAVDPSVVSQLNTSATVSVGLALRNLEARG